MEDLRQDAAIELVNELLSHGFAIRPFHAAGFVAAFPLHELTPVMNNRLDALTPEILDLLDQCLPSEPCACGECVFFKGAEGVWKCASCTPLRPEYRRFSYEVPARRRVARPER